MSNLMVAIRPCLPKIVVMMTVLGLTAVSAAFATDTTRRGKLQVLNGVGAVPVIADSVAVTTEAQDSLSASLRNPYALTLIGYQKRASDTHEEFNVTNNTQFHVTGARLLLRYFTPGGTEVIDEQQVVIALDLAPGESQQVTIPSFDISREYYYVYGSQPRLKASPFDVRVRIISYSVEITNYP